MSYVSLLAELLQQVETDVIPEKEKKEIVDLISELSLKLWKYSD